VPEHSIRKYSLERKIRVHWCPSVWTSRHRAVALRRDFVPLFSRLYQRLISRVASLDPHLTTTIHIQNNL